MLRIEKTEDKQFPYIVHGIGGGKPQKFTDKALKELHKLISAEITIHNSEYKQCQVCKSNWIVRNMCKVCGAVKI